MDRIEKISRQELHGRTKAERIANYLEEQILSKRLQSGESLPSQQELGEQFSASSRSIREAFKRLEAKGLLTVSQGKRACVTCNNLNHFVESLSNAIIRSGSDNIKLLLDLVQVLTSVEVSAAREFSRNPHRREIVRDLYALAEKMEEQLSAIRKYEIRALKEFYEEESAYHKLLVRSNDNIILNAIYENLSPLLEQQLPKLAMSYEEYEKKVREYRYIAEALESGQTDLAVALVLVNLTNLKKKIEAHTIRQSGAALA